MIETSRRKGTSSPGERTHVKKRLPLRTERSDGENQIKISEELIQY